MTIKNFTGFVENNTLYLSWEKTLAYTWIYEDSEVVAGPLSGTTWSGVYTSDAVYQAVDSATLTPTPAAPSPQPARRMRFTWSEVSGNPLRYEITVNGTRSFIQANGGPYTYTTPRLAAGAVQVGILAYDAAGNVSTVDYLNHEIKETPPPVQAISLAQSGAGNITLTIDTPPTGW